MQKTIKVNGKRYNARQIENLYYGARLAPTGDSIIFLNTVKFYARLGETLGDKFSPSPFPNSIKLERAETVEKIIIISLH